MENEKDPWDHFMAKVEIDAETGCWIWTGAVDGGYGVHYHAVGRYAYRFAYCETVGPIPEGYRLRRTCASRLCVNPEHWKRRRIPGVKL